MQGVVTWLVGLGLWFLLWWREVLGLNPQWALPPFQKLQQEHTLFDTAQLKIANFVVTLVNEHLVDFWPKWWCLFGLRLWIWLSGARGHWFKFWMSPLQVGLKLQTFCCCFHGYVSISITSHQTICKNPHGTWSKLLQYRSLMWWQNGNFKSINTTVAFKQIWITLHWRALTLIQHH